MDLNGGSPFVCSFMFERFPLSPCHQDAARIWVGHTKKALECDTDDQDEFETLQKYWLLFHEFTNSKKVEDAETGEFLVSKNGRTNCVISNFAQRRETFIVEMLGVTPELECSRWHGFLARLLLASHGDAELFVQVQLPFLAYEAAQPSTNNLRAEFYEDGKPLFDLWEKTKQFVVQSCKRKHRQPQGVDDIVENLKDRLKALIDVAPKIWKSLFIIPNQVNFERWEQVSTIIGDALGDENFDAHNTIVGSLLAAYPEVLLEEDEGDKGDQDATMSESAHRILKELCNATNETNDENETNSSNCLRLLKDLQSKLQGQATSSACASSRFLDSNEVPSLDVLPSLLNDYDSWRTFLEERKSLAGTILQSMPESLQPHLERLKAIKGPEQLLPEDDVGLLRDMLLALEMPKEESMERLLIRENTGASDVQDGEDDGGARNTEDAKDGEKIKVKTKKRKKAKAPSKKRKNGKKRKVSRICKAAEVSSTPISLVQSRQLVRRGHIDEMNLDFLEDVNVEENQPIEPNEPLVPLEAESDPHPSNPLQVPAPVTAVAPDPELFALFGQTKMEHLSEDQNRRLGLARSLMRKFVHLED